MSGNQVPNRFAGFRIIRILLVLPVPTSQKPAMAPKAKRFKVDVGKYIPSYERENYEEDRCRTETSPCPNL
eukprot:5759795-Pyramimonas_sp.AAC.1